MAHPKENYHYMIKGAQNLTWRQNEYILVTKKYESEKHVKIGRAREH